MLDTGRFYFYQRRPVAIVKLTENTAFVRYIQRNKQEEIEVNQSFLIPFSNKEAETELKDLHKQIGSLNMRIHAINECLQYHTE